MFKALLLEESDGKVVPRISQLSDDAFPSRERSRHILNGQIAPASS